MKKRFTEEQIMRILQEAEQASNTRDVCCKHNSTEQKFYRRRNKYGGMDVLEARRLEELEKENSELKKMVAEQALDIRMLKDVNAKKWQPHLKRSALPPTWSQQYQASERRACEALDLNRNTKRTLAKEKPLFENIERVKALLELKDRWGYRKIYDRMQLDGAKIDRERLRLIRKREGLQVRRKQVKKWYPGTNEPLLKAAYPGHVRAYDFVMDATDCSRRLRILTIVDEFTKESYFVAPHRSFTSGDVERELRRLFVIHGQPGFISSDNGSVYLVTGSFRPELASTC